MADVQFLGLPDADLAFLADLARRAGAAIEEVKAAGFSAIEKQDGSPVTAADLAADKIITAGLLERWPNIPIISEEHDTQMDIGLAGGQFFLVDPLDGTKEFVAGRREYTVNIGLIENLRPVLGVIYAPSLDKSYVGKVGVGAFKQEGEQDFIAISARPRPLQWVAATSRLHSDDATSAQLAEMPVGERKVVGSSLKFCLVAEGSADIYLRHGPTMEWDTAAGDAIATAAGASMAMLDQTSPFLYGKSADKFLNPGFIAVGPK